ncbi:COG1470 family protein [Candidatus Pyrohabitans sp.]
MRVLIITLLVLLGAVEALNITEYRGMVFYSNGSQDIYTDILLVNSTELYGTNITYRQSFFIPFPGNYAFSLSPEPFNLSVTVEAQSSGVVYRIKNNYSFAINISARITGAQGNPVCGSYCVQARTAGGEITANFSIPALKTGVLFITPVSSLAKAGNSYLKFSFSSFAEMNSTVPLLLDVEKSSYDNTTWHASFNVKNLQGRDAFVHVRTWYVVNGSTHELSNYSYLLPGRNTWSTSTNVVTGGVPTFYISASAVNSSKREVNVKPAYPVNLSNPNAGYVYGEALVLSNITAVVTSPLRQIEITSFSVVPEAVTYNQIVDFIIEVKNTGSMAEIIEPEIEIYAGGSLVKNLSLLPQALAAGSNATISTSYLATLDTREYRVVAKVYYNNRSSYASAQKMFSVISGGEEVSGEIKKETPRVRFPLFPVLIEGRPGETSAVSFEVENPSGTGVSDLKLELAGIPADWVSLQPREVSLAGGESTGINLAISVPLSALPGDHKAVLKLSNAEEEASAFFIFRIKPYPPRFEKPAVLRKVYLDERQNSARVSMEVENSGVRVEAMEIVEEIPKEIASHVAEIEFNRDVRVIEADPVVAWRLSGVDPYEIYTLEYRVSGIAERYSPYIYWSLRQLNMFYRTVKSVELLQFSGALAAYATPGEEAEVRLRVTNPSQEALKLTFKIAIPPGWKVDPPEITRLLLPGYVQELVFRVTPPQDATPGSYTLVATVTGEDSEVSQPLTLILQEAPKRLDIRKFLIPVLTFVALLLLVYAAAIKYRKRKIYRRDVVDAVGRIKRSMEKER